MVDVFFKKQLTLFFFSSFLKENFHKNYSFPAACLVHIDLGNIFDMHFKLSHLAERKCIIRI